MSEIRVSTEPRLTRTCRVLDLIDRQDIDIDVRFAQPDDEVPEHGHKTFLTIRRSLWRHLGSPHQLTVTIEPGDLLNE